MKRQQRTFGAVLRVPLENDMQIYALTLPEADFAFFDARSIAPTALRNLTRPTYSISCRSTQKRLVSRAMAQGG